ncbi:MAG: GTP cyclohydrolase I [Sulfolobaceae archaeon]
MENQQLSENELIEEIARRIREILLLLGEDPNREGLIETPTRVARALLEMTRGLREPEPKVKVFNLIDDRHSEYYSDKNLVLVRDISFSSLCEHHMLPIIGKVHVAYVINDKGKVAGLSKIIRIVNYYSSRLQLQERLVEQIADALYKSDFQPKGVMVISNGIHMCTYIRGVKDRNAKMTSIATRGIFNTRKSLRNYVLKLLQLQGDLNLIL